MIKASQLVQQMITFACKEKKKEKKKKKKKERYTGWTLGCHGPTVLVAPVFGQL